MRAELENGIRCFVRALEKLPVGDLQRLRRASGQARGEDEVVNDLFNDLWRKLPHREPNRMRRASWLVATLYPWNLRRRNPGARSAASLGHGFARLAFRARDKPGRNRVEARFLRLLDAHSGQLQAALLDAVRILEREGVPVEWGRLAVDLADWEERGRPVQGRWFAVFRGLAKGE